MTLRLNKSATRLVERELLPGLRVLVGNHGSPRWRGWAAKMIELFTPPKPSSKKQQARKRKKLLASGDREAHRLETAAIREEVFRRAGATCELHLAWFGYPGEMHHLESGRGRRKQLQAVSNCMKVCRECHNSYHEDPERFRGRVIAWATKYGYPIPSRFRPSRFRRPPRSAALSATNQKGGGQ